MPISGRPEIGAPCPRDGGHASLCPPYEPNARSFHGDLRRCGFVEAVVAGPLERDRSACARHRVEGDEGMGGDCGVEVGAEKLLAVVAAGELGDDVARDRLAHVVVAIAGLHDVRDQRLDLDGLPALGLGRHIDEGARHDRSSRQAASVTITSAEADQNEPSLSSAIATMVCVSARRKRVVMRPRPARGPRRALMMLGCGFFSLKTWIALTWSCGVIGLSTSIASATVLPFSTSGGTSIVTLPLPPDASPTTWRIARRIDSGVAAAGSTLISAAPRPARPASSMSRRVASLLS